MDDAMLRNLIRRKFAIRVEPEMSRYIARQLDARCVDGLEVFGGDARTGVPLLQALPLNELHAALAATPSQ